MNAYLLFVLQADTTSAFSLGYYVIFNLWYWLDDGSLVGRQVHWLLNWILYSSNAQAKKRREGSTN